MQGPRSPLQNFTPAARAIFGEVRTPASFFAGSSLVAVFAFSDSDVDDTSIIRLTLLRVYAFCMIMSFVLSISTVIVATGAEMIIIEASFDPMAENLYEMLLREFDYEFALTRWAFMVTLLCFLIGNTIRFVLEFKLLDVERRNHLIGVLSIMTTAIAQLLAHVNRTLFCWKNLLELTIYVIRLCVVKAWEEKSFLQVVSIWSTVVGAVFLIRAVTGGRKGRIHNKAD